jgi:hypothetical protein
MPRSMLVLLLLLPLAASAQQPLVPHPLPAAHGRTITLSLPRDFQINVALTGLHRVRFFAMAPDHRLFVTDMYDRTDNTRVLRIAFLLPAHNCLITYLQRKCTEQPT